MKRILFLSSLIVFFTISLVSMGECSNQTPVEKPSKVQPSITEKQIKNDDELKEKCRIQSADFFRDDQLTNRRYPEEMWSYLNHYSKKLNKCFIVITITFLPKNENKTMDTGSITKFLYDVDEYKSYGSSVLVPKKHFNGVVNDKKCQSEEEWNELIKPYMEE